MVPHFHAALEKGNGTMTTGTKEDPWELTTPPGTRWNCLPPRIFLLL